MADINISGEISSGRVGNFGNRSVAAGRNPIEQKETKGTKKAVVDRQVSVMPTNGAAPSSLCLLLFQIFACRKEPER